MAGGWAIRRGFNPCFCGIRSTAVAPEYRPRMVIVFQSLFLWNSLNGCDRPPRPPPPPAPVSILVFVEFAQRLDLPPGSKGDDIEVSILVFVEFAQRRLDGHRRPDQAQRAAPGVSILVFVEFAQRRMSPRTPMPVTHDVSILVFVEFAQRQKGVIKSPKRVLMFQSLFLWNSLNGRGLSRGRASTITACFNPCFCGIRSTAAT